jgi:peptidoglycan LD-endopeptidase LytH
LLVTAAFAAVSSLAGPAARSAAAPQAAAVSSTIGQAATVTAPAKRLRQSGSLLFPMDPEPTCYILNNFGDYRSPTRTHEGVDTMATLGQAVYAVVDGTLTRQALVDSPLSGNAWGLTSTLDGTYYFYAHLSAFADALSVGSKVTRGQVIGYVGDTGDAGPGNYHLHFEVHPGSQKNAAVDPVPLLEIPSACTLAKKTQN